MTGLGQDHRDRLTLVSKPRAQTSPPPPCGDSREFAMHRHDDLYELRKVQQCVSTCLSLVWWLWWLWCGQVSSERVSVHTRTRMQLIKMDQCQCTGPFGWTDQPENPLRLFPPKEGSRRPRCKPHPTPSRGKRLRGPPTSPPSPSEEGERNLFHLLGVGCPRSGILCDDTPGRVFLVSRTLLPTLLPVSEG